MSQPLTRNEELDQVLMTHKLEEFTAARWPQDIFRSCRAKYSGRKINSTINQIWRISMGVAEVRSIAESQGMHFANFQNQNLSNLFKSVSVFSMALLPSVLASVIGQAVVDVMTVLNRPVQESRHE